MKTTLMMLALAGTLLATVAPTAQAVNTDPVVKIAINGEATNYCNGVYEYNCTCRAGVWYCYEGDECAYYVAGVCVQGGSAAASVEAAPVVAEAVGPVEVPQVEGAPTGDAPQA